MSSGSVELPDAARLSETLRRLDALIEETGDPERMRSGLGMRLALSLALETREGKAPGSDTSALVAGWVERYGREAVDRAVSVARVFLTQPGELAEKLRKRLVPGGEG